MAIHLTQGMPGAGMSLWVSGSQPFVNVGAPCVTTPAPAGLVVSPLSPGEFRKAAPPASRVGVLGAVLPL